MMKKLAEVNALFLILVLVLLAGCGGGQSNPGPLSSNNLNLIFVSSEGLAFNAPGDINPHTANLTDQGLQRSLFLGDFLHQEVLGSRNVSGIYALAPMTHLQTANHYPDMVGLETIQQFSVLNRITLSTDLSGGNPYTGQNYPVNASYAPGTVPSGVAVPSSYCPTCQGLDFNDANGDNDTLVNGIVAANVPGFYVFSAPWETTSALLVEVNQHEGYNLDVPVTYSGPNYVHVISISSSGDASLSTFNSDVDPPSTYPVLPLGGVVSAACTKPTPATITVTGGVGGAILPTGINTNETVYIVRHAEAHPQNYWSDNNYVGAGQWRALDLPNALLGKIDPDQVWSQDPAQFAQGTVAANGDQYWSTLAPPLTVAPYAIANNLPFHLVSSFDVTGANSAQLTQEFFFSGGAFSNQKVLLGWNFVYIPQIVNALLASYYPGNSNPPTAPTWVSTNYDSVWKLTLDAQGNLTADFTQCEGIDSAALPAMPPRF